MASCEHTSPCAAARATAARRVSRKPRKGATPVPGPIMMMGARRSAGCLKSEALHKTRQERDLSRACYAEALLLHLTHRHMAWLSPPSSCHCTCFQIATNSKSSPHAHALTHTHTRRHIHTHTNTHTQTHTLTYIHTLSPAVRRFD